jgi:multidrug resistance efflux pump
LTLLLALSTVSLAVRLALRPAPTANPSVGESGVAAATEKPPPATADPTGAGGNAVVLESKGYIIPAHQIQVSPIEVAGRIVELFIEEGKRFNQGDVLAQLDKSSYDAEHMEAVAAAASARARLNELKNGSRPEEIAQAFAELGEARETLKQARLEYERNKNLGAGALSTKEFEAAQFAYSALRQRVNKLEHSYELIKIGPRKERIDAAEAELNTTEARVKRAKWRLDNCTIRAPVSGTILKKSAELGNLVSPLSFNVSASICEMADLSDLEVELDIIERDVAKVQVGQPCKIRTEAYPDRVYDGVVDRLMPIANRAKGAVPVRVKVRVPREEEGRYLKPDMGASVTFLRPAQPGDPGSRG